jgi:hypothetical protein
MSGYLVEKKINFTAFLGIAFIMLAFLRITDSVVINPIILTSLAIAGLCFVIADFFYIECSFIWTLEKFNKFYNEFKKDLKMSIDINPPLKSKKEKFIEKYSYKLFLFFNFLAIVSILVLPYINYFQNMIPKNSTLINDFTLYFSLGLTLYISHKKEKAKTEMEKYQYLHNLLVKKSSENALLLQENILQNEIGNTLEYTIEILKKHKDLNEKYKKLKNEYEELRKA